MDGRTASSSTEPARRDSIKSDDMPVLNPYKIQTKPGSIALPGGNRIPDQPFTPVVHKGRRPNKKRTLSQILSDEAIYQTVRTQVTKESLEELSATVYKTIYKSWSDGKLKKNFLKKIFGYLARCEFWLKLGW